MPEGIRGRYLLKWARKLAPVTIDAQAQISRTMMALLQGKDVAKGKRAA